MDASLDRYSLGGSIHQVARWRLKGNGRKSFKARPSHNCGLVPLPAEVGCFRLRPLKSAELGKPEFGWERGGEGLQSLVTSESHPPPLRREGARRAATRVRAHQERLQQQEW